MQIGIFAKTFEGTAPLDVLKQVRAAGYEAVQYNMACSGLPSLPGHVPDEVAAAVASAAAETGVVIAAVSATYNMIHPDRSARETGRRAFGAIAAAAPRMGCRVVTVCTGSRDPRDQWRAHPDNGSDEAWQEMLAEFRLIAPVAERLGLLIGVEPELGNVVSTPQKARRLLDAFPGGPVRIVLDPANLFENGNAANVRALVDEAVELVGREVVLAHAKDRDSEGKVVAAGEGVVDWRRYFAALRGAGFAGPVVTHGLAAGEAAGVARFLRAQLDGVAAS